MSLSHRSTVLRKSYYTFLPDPKRPTHYRFSQSLDHVPGCYGAFASDHVDVLFLDLCDGILNERGRLSAPER
jgi:hypothetical protein